MGYDIYITRQLNWYDNNSSKQISLKEWMDYIASDKEMRLENFAEAQLQHGKILRIEKEGMAAWLKYAGDKVNGHQAWFYYSDGNISVKNPDPAIMYKMLSIAHTLNARLQGEEGEEYTFSAIKDLESFNRNEIPSTKPWWKFW